MTTTLLPRPAGMLNNIGDNWLLLRGLARETEHWGAFRNTLQTVFPLAHIGTID